MSLLTVRTFFCLALAAAVVYSKSYSIRSVDRCACPSEVARVLLCREDESKKIFMIDFDIIEKIVKFNITASIHVWTDSAFKHLFKSTEVDFCKFMRKTKNASPSLKIILDAIKATSGNIIHKCPYVGRHSANITVSRNVVSFIPAGRYRVSIEARVDAETALFNVSAIVDILSSD